MEIAANVEIKGQNWKCSSCGSENENSRQFCDDCGKPRRSHKMVEKGMDITNILGSETPLEGPTALNENAGGGRKGKKSWVKTTKTNNLQNPMKSSQTEKLEETEYGKSSFIAGGPAVGLNESETTRPSPSLSHSNYYLVS